MYEIETDGEVSILELVKLPSSTDRVFMFFSSLMMSLVVWEALKGSSNPSKFFMVYLILYVLCYYPATAIALRNISLSGWPRRVFCFTAIPMACLFLMFSAAVAFSVPGFETTWNARGGRRPGIFHGVIVSVVPVMALFGFYRLMKFINVYYSDK